MSVELITFWVFAAAGNFSLLSYPYIPSVLIAFSAIAMHFIFHTLQYLLYPSISFPFSLNSFLSPLEVNLVIFDHFVDVVTNIMFRRKFSEVALEVRPVF